MYKIQNVHRYNVEFIKQYPDLVESVKRHLAGDFALQMLNNNCFQFTETELDPEIFTGVRDIKITGYVMTPQERELILNKLDYLKTLIGPNMILLEIHDILTKPPKADLYDLIL